MGLGELPDPPPPKDLLGQFPARMTHCVPGRGVLRFGFPWLAAVCACGKVDRMKDPRKQAERDFHSKREIDRLSLSQGQFCQKYPNKRFYDVARASKAAWRGWVSENCKGKVVLDYCCGLGRNTLELARHGAWVYGIDISSVEIASAKNSTAEAGLSERVQYIVMDAENLGFKDHSFDVVFCCGVLHHLAIEQAYQELARVLKPTGKIICIEAVGHNPLFNLYRKLTPHLRTAWEADHILTNREVSLARSYFAEVRVDFYHLLVLLATPFRRTRVFNTLVGFFEKLDSLILRLPGIRLWAWQMIFILAKPRDIKDANLAD
jgi:SAM-dependent methyltransferase